MNWKRLAFLVALCAGVAEAFPANAEPISTAIAVSALAVAATTGISVAVATTIITSLLITAVSTGLSYAAKAIAGKPAVPSIGIRGTLEGGEEQFRSFAVGKFVTAGTLVYANTWTNDSDHPNAYLTIVIQLADIPITSLLRIFVGDTPGIYATSGGTHAHVPGHAVAAFSLGSKDYLWAKFYDGTQTTADPDLINRYGSDPRYPWTSSFVGTGIPYVILTALYNPAIFSGFPHFKMEATGMKFYDQRLDTTEGGSGAQTFADPTSYTYSDNPMLVINNILRGIKNPTSTGYVWMYGLQTLPSIRVPSDSWFTAMNECDAVIHDIDGDNEPQFRCGAEIPINMQPMDAIAELLKSCNGRMAEIGGTYKALAGAASVSPAYSFTDDDVIITQGQNFDQFPSLDNLINAFTAKYPDPDEAWNPKDAPPLYDTDLEAEDGGRRLVSNVTYGTVPYKSQVQRLMVSAKAEARKFRRHSIVLPPAAWGLEPNDTVQWNSVKNGYIDKLFLVEQVTDNDNLDNAVVIVEIDPSDYDFDPDTQYQPVTVNTIYGPIDTSLVAPNALSVFASFKSLVLSWTNTPNYNIEAIEVWRSSTDDFADAFQIADLAPFITQFVNDGLDTGDTFWYWIRYRSLSREWSLFSPLDSVPGATGTTLTVVGGDLDADAVTDAMAAAGLTGIEIVSTIPTVGNYEGRTVFLTTVDGSFAAGKLYRYHSGAFTAEVPTVDLTGQIQTIQIVDAGVTGPKIDTAAITNPKIAALAITGDKIQANTVTASRLEVAPPGGALNSDPTPNDIDCWQFTFGTFDIVSYSGNINALHTTSVSAFAINYYPTPIPLPILLNKTYRVHGEVISGSGTDGVIYIGVIFLDTSFGSLGTLYPAANGVAASSAWRSFEGTFDSSSAPSGSYFMAPIVYGNYGATVNPLCYFKDIRIEEVLPSTLIKDGAIITDKLDANAVTAAKIAANTITANEIAANAITASELAANSVVAGKIAADAVEAGVIAAGAIDAANIMVDNLIVTSKFVDLSVTTGKIADNAVTTGLSLIAAGPTAVHPGSYTDLLNGTYTASGQRVLISFNVTFDSDFTGFEENGLAIRIYNGATLVREFHYLVGTAVFCSELFWTSSTSGSHTWHFEGAADGTGANDTSVYDYLFEVKEWQK